MIQRMVSSQVGLAKNLFLLGYKYRVGMKVKIVGIKITKKVISGDGLSKNRERATIFQ